MDIKEKNVSMARLSLVVMAAGMGSRYGGLKQVDPVGPQGEMIIHYSVYDALRAGFEQVVFVIRQEIAETFREHVGCVIEPHADVRYVYQELDQLPAGVVVPAGRRKPWGTAHAVLSAQAAVHTPFAVINADDFYGATAYTAMAGHLRQAADRAGQFDIAMIGYPLRNTLSEHGHVARGVCELTPDGDLVSIQERTRIQAFEDGIKYWDEPAGWVTLAPETVVSMNVWGFTPGIFEALEQSFGAFLRTQGEQLLTAEFYLPGFVGQLVSAGRARVRVLPTAESWFGVTYQEDRPRVQAAIRALSEQGYYPERLWI